MTEGALNGRYSRVAKKSFWQKMELRGFDWTTTIYDFAIKVQYSKHSDFHVGKDLISYDRKYFSHVNLDLELRTLKVELTREIIISTNV